VYINGILLGHLYSSLITMSNLLDSSEKLEKPVINAVGNQAKQLVDELLPQIRLAAYENDGASIVDMKFGLQFSEEGEECIVASEAIVKFPEKRIYAEEICKK
jgi:hypothetical protein